MLPAGITMCPFLCHPIPPTPQTHTDTCLPWQIACDVPLWTWHERIRSLSSGFTAEESSSGRDAPEAAAWTPRESLSAIRWETSAVGRQQLVASRSLNLLHRNLLKCARGAKQGAAVVEPVVILIPQKRKFMHRWNKRTAAKHNVPIFSPSYWVAM